MIAKTRQITFTVPETFYSQIVEASAAIGVSVGPYARRMVEAAHYARTAGATSNPTLRTVVERVCALMALWNNVRKVADVLGLKPETVERIANAWEQETGRKLA